MDLARLRTMRPTMRVSSLNSWYRIENKASTTAKLYIFDEIGDWGVNARDFANDLTGITAPEIELHLSSPGGDVFAGVAIYQSLKDHPAAVNVVIDSLAASAASFIAMAGDTIKIARNAQMMIHDAHGLSIGNAKDMRETATLLEKVSDNIADIYSQRAGGTVEDWRARMLAETWYSAQEAVEAGLADEILGSSPKDAPGDQVPEIPQNNVETPVSAITQDVEAFRLALLEGMK